jgi:uncharacterized protein YdbL (DUF1318 family)
MNTQITKEAGVAYPPIFKCVIEDIPGGILFDVDDLPSATEFLEEGVLLAEDGSTSGLFHVCKTAKVYEALAAAGTALKVYKDHLFDVGDFITNGQVSTAITVINTTGSLLYDTLTLTATLDAVEAVPINSILYQAASATTNAATASTATVEDTAEDYLAIANPRGNTNDIIVTINQNGSDALAVTYTPSTKTLLIRLADTTAASNNAAAVQAAIRALDQDGGVDFTDWTATGTGWDGGQTAATLTDPSHRMSGGVEKPAGIAAKYSPSCILANQLDVTVDNPSGSAVVRGTVNESILPYYVHDDQKAALTDRIRFA